MTHYDAVIVMRTHVNVAFTLCQERAYLKRLVMPVGFLLVGLDCWLRDYRHGVQCNKVAVRLMTRSLIYLDMVYLVEHAYAEKQLAG